MSEFITLSASDGHKFQAWYSPPQGRPKAGMVVIQEIFGVNHHIREVTDRYAREGYLAVAPALFDRYQRNYDTGYTEADVAAGREIVGKVDWDKAMLDIEAARVSLAALGSIGVVGFCMGGTLAWLSATRLKFTAAVSYYGGRVGQYAKEKPNCPVIMHFGKTDQSIPLTVVEEFKAAQPKVPVFLYDAGHGFSCNERGSFNQVASDEAWKRTQAHFTKFL
jgi:carboxymethylenebutenolidase